MKEIKLNDKVVKTIQVNKAKRIVTVVSDDLNARARNALCKLIDMMRVEEGKKPLNAEPIEEKVVTQSQPINADEFDPYVGVALALAYNLFGSKTQFRKYVKQEILKEPKEENKKLPSFTELTEQHNLHVKELSEKYTLQQLRDVAKASKLIGYTRLTKAELIEKLYHLL